MSTFNFENMETAIDTTASFVTQLHERVAGICVQLTSIEKDLAVEENRMSSHHRTPRTQTLFAELKSSLDAVHDITTAFKTALFVHPATSGDNGVENAGVLLDQFKAHNPERRLDICMGKLGELQATKLAKQNFYIASLEQNAVEALSLCLRKNAQDLSTDGEDSMDTTTIRSSHCSDHQQGAPDALHEDPIVQGSLTTSGTSEEDTSLDGPGFTGYQRGRYGFPVSALRETPQREKHRKE